jgi:methionyl-tRNA formyltransferase
VTIMRVVTELDAGPMLGTLTRQIGPDETSVDVERGLAGDGAGLLLDVVDRLAQGPVVEVAQDDARATYAPKLLKTESPIDWSLPARAIHNRVRGLQPWPMASATLDGLRVLIHRTAVDDVGAGAAAGVVVEARGDVLAVAAGDGKALRILQLQPEGRRTMSVREFLSGRRISPGSTLGQP